MSPFPQTLHFPPARTSTVAFAERRLPRIGEKQMVRRQSLHGFLAPQQPNDSNDDVEDQDGFWASDEIEDRQDLAVESPKAQSKRTPQDDPERQVAVDLLARMGVGDELALADFYDRFSPVLYGMALKMMKDESASEDVLQEAFICIWRKAANYNSQLSSPFTWAVMILRNKAIDRLRSRQRVEKIAARAVEAFAHAPDTDELSAEQPFFREQRAIVRSALSQLSEEQRLVIELAFFSGLTHEEIAQQLLMPLGTVKTRIRRTLIQLRDLVEGAR
jgi:RNA polymerase sigma-70 factor, ECF subfamily